MNIFIYVCIIFFFTVIQTAILNTLLPFYLSPDIVTLFIIYVAMARGFREGLLYTVLASYMLSLSSSAGFLPLFIFSVVAYSVARYVSMNFYVNDVKYLLLSILLPVAANKLSMLLWINTGNLLFFMENFFYMTVVTLITSLLGLLLFRVFNWIDVRTGLINLESVVEK